MEFLQRRGKHGDLKKVTQTVWFSIWKLTLMFCGWGCARQFCVSAVALVCVQESQYHCCSIYIRAVLLGASCFLTHCQLPLGKHFRGGHLSLLSSGKLNYFSAVNSWHLRALNTSWGTSNTLVDQTRNSYMNSYKSFPVSQLADDHRDGK